MKAHALLPLAALCLALLPGCATAKRDSTNGGSFPDSDQVLGIPLPDRNEGVSFLAGNVDRSRFAPVYFGYDSSTLGAAERPKLDAVAAATRADSASIIIAGFTDERGTPEYNRGLGERRALTVREELIRLGVNPARLQTVSFGEEMPADTGGGESAWARNRRVEFGVVQ